MRSFKPCLLCCFLLSMPAMCHSADPVFSGPQIGESLAPFKVTSVYGDSAGREVDPVKLAGDKANMLVFVHKLTRPGIALTRSLTGYAKSQSGQGAVSAIVWLDDDQAAAEQYLKRAKKSLNFSVPVGVSIDGVEGPGAYGLNRNVELTVIIAKDSKVTANFALVQPSVTEASKIASELAKLVGQPVPVQAEMEKLAYPGAAMKRGMQRGTNERTRPGNELRTLMKNLVAPGISKDEMNDAVKAIDKWVGDNKQRQSSLAKMASAVLERGMGSEAAQSVIKKWRETYGVKKATSKESEGT